MGKRFVVEDSFWQVFPDVEIGVLCVDGIKPTDQIGEEEAKAAAKFLDRANASAEEWLTSSAISQNEVVAVWRDAYRKFKTKKGARCSVENLLKRVLKDNPVGHIVPSVDVSNAISLKYALPIGAENIDAIEGHRRGGERPHAARRDRLPGRRRRGVPLLELARRPAHGGLGRDAALHVHHGERDARALGGPSRGHRRAGREVRAASGRDGHEQGLRHEGAPGDRAGVGATVTNKDFVTREHPETELV